MHAIIQKTGLKFCANHFLTEDFGKCVRIHGHDYEIHVSVRGKIQENGAVMDFSVLKRVIKRVIAPLEHKILIPSMGGAFSVQEDPTYPNHIIIISEGHVKYRFPRDLTFQVPKTAITAENLAEFLYERLKKQEELKDLQIQVFLSETPNNHVLVGDF